MNAPTTITVARANAFPRKLTVNNAGTVYNAAPATVAVVFVVTKAFVAAAKQWIVTMTRYALQTSAPPLFNAKTPLTATPVQRVFVMPETGWMPSTATTENAHWAAIQKAAQAPTPA
jgi:hypothetical protein